ncbi:hypothetical protein EW146_g7311 [Bondarzewia mesenterica]|uniref:Trafficking protein particle complex subunit 6B n=1 Tax=Bondarzewia mesenterica TaxID=1095465 RepID=A0A4S4LLP0_9AGAM|nr:hypothetical protein EW146_g7311 [Bondarzewia mesenterica]
MNPLPPSSAPSLSSLADPPPRLMDGPAMDYFLIELVQTLRQSSIVAAARARKVEEEMISSGLIPAPPPAPPTHKIKKEVLRESMGSTVSQTQGVPGKVPADEDEEGVRARLEAIGLHVGANITERLCHDRPIFSDTLDAIKFICKDLWAVCWDKQVDNLRTNHRGVYVLQDNTFKPVSRVSSWESRADATRRAKLVSDVTYTTGISIAEPTLYGSLGSREQSFPK